MSDGEVLIMLASDDMMVNLKEQGTTVKAEKRQPKHPLEPVFRRNTADFILFNGSLFKMGVQFVLTSLSLLAVVDALQTTRQNLRIELRRTHVVNRARLFEDLAPAEQAWTTRALISKSTLKTAAKFR